MALPDGWGDLTIDDLSVDFRAARGDRPREPEGTDLLPLLAEFRDADLERAHLKDFFETQLRPHGLRVYLLLLSTFIPFAIVDLYVLPSIIKEVLVVRFGVVFPIWVAITWRVARNYTQPLAVYGGVTILASFMGFFGWIAWVAPPPGSHLYFGYVALVVLGGPVIGRWTVRLSAKVGAVTLMYVLIFSILHPHWDTPSRIFLFVIYLSAVLFGIYGAFTIQTGARRTFLQWRISDAEREKSDWLLLNILPEPIAERLKADEGSIAERFTSVTVLFADIVGFTPLSARLPPEELVAMLNDVFCRFDDLAEEHGLEKIKTIGDAYMVAGGLPRPSDPRDAARRVADMALAMPPIVVEAGEAAGEALNVRIGIHSGPVVAGVIGKRKFVYDLWGDTVNVAARMESHGLTGEIQVTDLTADLLGDGYVLEPRGEIEIKGRGPMQAWLLHGSRAADRQPA